MIQRILKDRPTQIFIFISAFFVANALIAECIGGKIFSLEKTFGFLPSNFTIFGQKGLAFNLTCGVLLWPLEFVITDIVNEFYGPKAVKRISYTAVILISYAFLMFYLAIKIPPADFWISSGAESGIANMPNAFNAIFGQGMWIILGSLTAFLVSQLVDVTVFQKIKKVTGEKRIWLRATGSTLISQLVDSFIVLFIAFKLGKGWSWQLVLAICLVNYTYKFTMAIILTPLIYFIEKRITKYVGYETAMKMKLSAMGQSADGFENIPAAG
ncbi:MAG: queuosine precursor transporter [Ginsengibacter sp.]